MYFVSVGKTIVAARSATEEINRIIQYFKIMEPKILSQLAAFLWSQVLRNLQKILKTS